MLTRLKKTYAEFPPLFWIVVGTLFIDAIGSTLLFPFFALYITQKFGVGMTEAGILLGMSSLFGLIGSVIGGALTDRFGRRRLILFGLVFSALSSLSFGLAWDVKILYVLVIFVGLCACPSVRLRTSILCAGLRLCPGLGFSSGLRLSLSLGLRFSAGGVGLSRAGRAGFTRLCRLRLALGLHLLLAARLRA